MPTTSLPNIYRTARTRRYRTTCTRSSSTYRRSHTPGNHQHGYRTTESTTTRYWAYHYPQPIGTMAHIRGSQADNILMNHLQHNLQTALYFSALDPSLMPVHLPTRRAKLLLEQLPLLDRVARWYG